MKRFYGFLASIALYASAAYSYTFPDNTMPIKAADQESLAKMSSVVSDISSSARAALAFISVSKTVAGGPPMMGNDIFEYFFGGPRRGMPQQQQPRERKQQGLGSGFIVDLDKGYIMTNNHVIEGADEINIKLANDKSYKGSVVGRDKNTDIAIVQVKEKFKKDGLKALGFDTKGVNPGDFVIALGAPFGLEASVSFGVVSATSRGNLGDLTSLGDFIQTDAAINPGNSGGPLLNAFGRVIGVNSAIFSQTGGYAGIGFAVPASLATTVGQKLIEDGKISRGYIGVGLQPLDSNLAEEMKYPNDIHGALVAEVVGNGPAGKAGLRQGDIISQVNGQNVSSMNDVQNRIGLSSPGSTVKLTIFRDGKEKTVEVKLGEFPEDEALAADSSSQGGSLGVAVVTLSDNIRNQYDIKSQEGVFISQVQEGSAAEGAGLREGDVVIEVNRARVKSKEQFQKAIKGKDRLLLYLERQGRFFYASINMTS
ncbi:MAG: Do family serine endopeptidase [Oligoflexales bacterium]